VKLHDRLGLPREEMGNLPILAGRALPDPNTLFDQAFEGAEEHPQESQTLLAAALLSQARNTPEGRLSGALALIAKLVARANPDMTLGPRGSELREHLMPNGWRYTAQSWGRLRYAWREGMRDLLDVHEHDPIADALDEITRLNPAEPEPVSVAIQEQFPPPTVGFAITVLGLSLTGYGIYRNWQREKELERMARRRR